MGMGGGANHRRPSYLLSSFTGSTVRPKVEFVTAANDAYQAAIAVAMPIYPPAYVIDSLASALPTPSTRNVAASSKNTTEIATVVRSDAMNMYAVKMPHAIRNSPTALPSATLSVISLA